jgi:hypothetical protein
VLRVHNWELHFAILEGPINAAVRIQQDWYIEINLRAHPYEEMWQESQMYLRWMVDRPYLLAGTCPGLCGAVDFQF